MASRTHGTVRLAGAPYWAAFTLLAACNGVVGTVGSSPSGGSTTTGGPTGGGGGNPDMATGPTPPRVRRLTPSEYKATVNALLESTSAPAVDFPVDPVFHGYSNKSDALRVTSVLAQNLWIDVPAIASQAAQKLMMAPPCQPDPTTQDACATQILKPFVEKAYRRPIADDELAELMNVFHVGLEGQDFTGGITLVLQVVFQSAGLLYRTELGDDAAPGPNISINAYEAGQELSYLVTGGPPDAELTAAAASGALMSADEREKQALRLFGATGARAALGDFAAQWLEVAALGTAAKDPDVYPNWLMLREQMVAESGAFFAASVIDDVAPLANLFTANWTIASGDLATFYGGTPDASGRLTLPMGQRSGMLSQASFLAAHAQAVDGSPIRRGHFVRTRLLCQEIPPPPKSLVITLPPPDPTRTNRERFAEHATNATCAGCHQTMDPIGFGFENFDGIGQFRTTDNNKDVDASGTLVGTDIDGTFVGPGELAQKLAQSPTARQCFAQHWLEYSMGRAVDPDSQKALMTIAGDFMNGGTLRDMIVAIVKSDLFVTRVRQ